MSEYLSYVHLVVDCSHRSGPRPNSAQAINVQEGLQRERSQVYTMRDGVHVHTSSTMELLITKAQRTGAS